MKKSALVVFIASALLALGSWLSVDYLRGNAEERILVEKERVRLTEEAGKRQLSISDEVWQKIRKARTPQAWEKVLAEETPRLSGEERKEAELLARAKLFEVYFWQVEPLLQNAQELLATDKNHPTAQKYLERAKEIYARMDKLVSLLVDQPSDKSQNARVNYLKGKFYYRSLPLVEDLKKEQAKVLELISRSATHLSSVFDSSPKDYDASIALEVLQKKTKDMRSAGDGEGNKAKLRLELLPAPSREIGPQFGLGGGGEGRQ